MTDIGSKYISKIENMLRETNEVVEMYGFKDREDFGRWAQSGVPDIRFHFIEGNPDVGRMPLAIVTDGDDGLAKLSPPEGTVSTPDGFSVRLWRCQWMDLHSDLLDRYRQELENWDIELDSRYAAGS